MKEKISALMDGELEGSGAEALIDDLRRGGEARETWRLYHLAGDAMRDTRLLSDGFAARLAQRLQAEPTVLAPRRGAARPRWIAMPAAVAASLAAIGLVGWLAFGPQQPRPPSAPIAQAKLPPVANATTRPAKVPLPSATPDYLLAHQGFSPRIGLEGMAPYARTVSDEAIEGGR